MGKENETQESDCSKITLSTPPSLIRVVKVISTRKWLISFALRIRKLTNSEVSLWIYNLPTQPTKVPGHVYCPEIRG